MKPYLLLLSLFIFSCVTEPEDVHGCLDSQACNYNSTATIDNNSCIYEEDCTGVCGGETIVDACGECGGDGLDTDEDGICDDVDDCVIDDENEFVGTWMYTEYGHIAMDVDDIEDEDCQGDYVVYEYPYEDLFVDIHEDCTATYIVVDTFCHDQTEIPECIFDWQPSNDGITLSNDFEGVLSGEWTLIDNGSRITFTQVTTHGCYFHYFTRLN